MKNIKCILRHDKNPFRLEFSNALHYVTSRREHREVIFEDDDDQ
ncbi:hypothetical protein [Nitrosomonas sp.]|nr:hypothetical protein [Nitrosomonas sp.]MDO8894281.1 hypothetical protein [Nitrosomonas sp.]